MTLLRRARAFLTLRFLLVLLAWLLPAAARADTQDIAAASRSVVRVALIATDGDNAYFVGHGSGVVVAPGRILTNAHVVELTRTEPNIVLGVIPPEGTKSYGGRVIAFSPGNDLALIAIDPGAKLPVATFFTGAPVDGQQVVAIGYPGSVDRAQGLSLDDIIHPMAPVRSVGTVSTGRATRPFDTILHTAALASGNSGGPLVDACGRMLGVNSFGSVSDGNDAEYGFAVSDREIAGFLRQAGVQPQRTVEPCKSLAEIEAAQKIADEQAKTDAANRALAEKEKAMASHEQAQQNVIKQRENMMAVAALLLAGAAVSAAGAIHSASRRKRRMIALEVIAGLLLIAAAIVFYLRPGFDSIESQPQDEVSGNGADNAAVPVAASDSVGDNLCRIDNALSRVTVSDTQDVRFHWSADGCINGQTQMVQDSEGWSRIVVPNDEASISVRHFDPASGTYRSDKYLIDADTARKARAIRQTLGWSGCTADPARLAALAKMQGDIAAVLPDQPNERLIYHCQPSKRP